MKSALFHVTVVVAIAVFAGDLPAGADEPAATKASGRFTVLNVPDGGKVESGQLLVDLSSTLVDGNGLGIDVSAPDATLRAQLGLEPETGLVIKSAPEESRGAKAGLKVHDIIVECNGQKIGDTEKLRDLLEAADGQSVKLRVLRQGKSLDLQATPKNPLVGRLAANRLWKDYLGTAVLDAPYRIGVTLSGTDQALRSQLRLAEGEGLVVTEVVEGSPAATAGVQKHDVLIVLDSRRLTTVEAINSQIQEIKDKEVELRLLRGGKELALQIAPRKTQQPAADDQVITIWDTHNCQSCHQRGVDAAHLLMGTRLHAVHSAWTDGHRHALFRFTHEKSEETESDDTSQSPQQQVEALKTQIADMQKAISALEAALKRQEPKEK